MERHLEVSPLWGGAVAANGFKRVKREMRLATLLRNYPLLCVELLLPKYAPSRLACVTGFDKAPRKTLSMDGRNGS